MLIRNINEEYGEPVVFEGETEADAVAVMQADVRACGDEFADAVITAADYEVVQDTEPRQVTLAEFLKVE